jgi:phage shock protein B
MSPFTLFIGFLSIVAVVIFAFLMLVKMMTRLIDRKDERAYELDKEESAILETLHQGMEKMEQRIEALETILIDKRK